MISLYCVNLSSGILKLDFGRFLDEKGLIWEPDVLGFSKGITLSELTYLNLNRISESVSSMSNIRDGSDCWIVLIILCPLIKEGIYACKVLCP